MGRPGRPLRRGWWFVSATAVIPGLLSACWTPFLPGARVQITQVSVQGNLTYTVPPVWSNAPHAVDVSLSNASSVDVQITSYAVVYQDRSLAAPPAALGGAAGRRVPISYVLSGESTNTGPSTGVLSIAVLTTAMYQYIAANAGTISAAGGMDLFLTIGGTDANNHDVKLQATFHLDV